MRILLADDDPGTRQALAGLIREEGHEVLEAGSGSEVLRIMERPDPPGLVLLDWQMPEMDGLKIIRRLKPLRLRTPLYLVIVTADGSFDGALEALDAGADDTMTKPVRPEQMLARLRVCQRHLELQQDFITAVETLQTQALQDELTGLLNRRAFLNRLESEAHRAHRVGSGIAVIMADLDHFKHVNDTHGHLAGDAVLAESALRMGRAMRAFDVVGRYGGEEFAICVPLSADPDVHAVCERIRLSICEEPIRVGEDTINQTVSIGCIIVEHVEEDLDMSSVLDRADAALYTAKRLGRNRCIIRNLRRSEETVESTEI